MNEIEINIFKKNLAVLDVYYNCDKLLKVLDWYLDGLNTYSLEDVCEAITEHVNASAFYPKISDIKKLIKEKKEKEKARISKYSFDVQQKLRDDYERYAINEIMQIYESLNSIKKNNLKRVFTQKILTNKGLLGHFKKLGLDDEYNRRDFSDFLYVNFLTFKQKVFSLDQYVQKRFDDKRKVCDEKISNDVVFDVKTIEVQKTIKCSQAAATAKIGVFGG